MPHLIILGDEIDCIKTKLNAMQKVYNDLKQYAEGLPGEVPQEITDALHDAEHLAENICNGNSLQGKSIDGCTTAMQNLLP